jgi:hypothetical protein
MIQFENMMVPLSWLSRELEEASAGKKHFLLAFLFYLSSVLQRRVTIL